MILTGKYLLVNVFSKGWVTFYKLYVNFSWQIKSRKLCGQDYILFDKNEW